MKVLQLLFYVFIVINSSFARHGKGGSITYEYLGKGASPGTSKYKIVVKHYIDCAGIQFIEPSSFVGIFTGGNNLLYNKLVVPESYRETNQKMSFDRCINQPPDVCYVVVSYVTETDLPDNIFGYTIAEQECCRILGIINVPNSSSYGITNTNTIPGVIDGVVYRTNSSPVFAQKDTVVICQGSYFSLDFGANDSDGDMLKYAFTPAKTGGSVQTRQPDPPPSPPYADLPYQGGYTALEPLGAGVTINANTGIISGIAPATLGSYIIAVAASEYRNGILIGISKKEVQVTVAECTLSAAILKPEYINCKNFSFNFENEFILTNVSRYSWDFGVAAIDSDTSNAIVGNYTYPDTGKFTLKLRVTSAAGCEDSTTADVLVYPVFKAGFKVAGSCLQFPFQFTDTSTAQYGTVNKWRWDFGDAYSSSNTSTLANPSHLFSVNGSYTATLIASGSKGCVDTASAIVMASDKPLLSLPFRDTLICSIDTLTLHVNSRGQVAWIPASTLLNPGSSSPIVFPKITTKYFVTVDEQGCVAKDSVLVHVLDFITVTLPADTTICTTDTIQLQPISAGLQYRWSPGVGLSNASIKNPKAAPLANTTYQLMVNLGKCTANTPININVVPYPIVRVSADTTICFGSTAQLRGSITGSSFNWSPVSSLQNANSLSPVASPQQTTAYQLTVRDTKGCPKASVDTVVVSVMPQIHAFAGNDTSIVAGQPLQLNANGGNAYLWSPANGLTNVTVPNPIAILSASVKAITYVVSVTNGTCSANDSINIKIFASGPEIFVPSAFTPNGDGKNDVLRPILVGIKSLETFRVFSRWGQIVYSSNQSQPGWNGEINGAAQQMGTYVYIAIGTTYLDQKITKKGTVILIR